MPQVSHSQEKDEFCVTPSDGIPNHLNKVGNDLAILSSNGTPFADVTLRCTGNKVLNSTIMANLPLSYSVLQAKRIDPILVNQDSFLVNSPSK